MEAICDASLINKLTRIMAFALELKILDYKQMEFATITDKDIKLAEDKLNNRPRKTLNYQTPNEVYLKEQEQLRKAALTT